MIAYTTKPIYLDPELSDYFARNLDGNTVHLPGNSNEVLPLNTVPGLFAVALCSKAVLALAEFKGIICAKQALVKFISPMLKGQTLILKGDYEDSPHRSLKNVVYRKCINHVFILNTDNKVMEYEIVQLVRNSN